MQYHAPTKQLTVSLDNLEASAAAFRFAIKMLRKAANFPLEGDGRPVHMTDACHAEQAILNGALFLGINLGATLPGELDVRKD
ncbi:hypothetical protein PVE_R2G0486 [Pseudomonas veronii 1YdBTEX2]|uniref:Uncharacterized protein n=1 Tax=Pseudomonas veronii 1YdBTEX2 TaxID=1295141 RepID=A0A1D3K8C8_PSEVE|nr:hypothetical protein PVE_R2G0486 [Pseudomonas veronii 1YdBTEX2]